MRDLILQLQKLAVLCIGKNYWFPIKQSEFESSSMRWKEISLTDNLKLLIFLLDDSGSYESWMQSLNDTCTSKFGGTSLEIYNVDRVCFLECGCTLMCVCVQIFGQPFLLSGFLDQEWYTFSQSPKVDRRGRSPALPQLLFGACSFCSRCCPQPHPPPGNGLLL